jgi:hypothetical protein
MLHKKLAVRIICVLSAPSCFVVLSGCLINVILSSLYGSESLPFKFISNDNYNRYTNIRGSTQNFGEFDLDFLIVTRSFHRLLRSSLLGHVYSDVYKACC